MTPGAWVARGAVLVVAGLLVGHAAGWLLPARPAPPQVGRHREPRAWVQLVAVLRAAAVLAVLAGMWLLVLGVGGAMLQGLEQVLA
jgi:hypothetical protein